MSNTGNTFQVPDEMREMMERGVTQARDGFSKVMKAADDAVSTIDEKAGSAQSQALELRKKTMDFTQSHVQAAFDLAANLVKAKNLDDVMKLQTEYMTKQFSALRGQIQEAGQTIQEQTKAAAAEFASESKKMQERAKDAVEKGVAAAKEAAASATKATKKK